MDGFLELPSSHNCDTLDPYPGGREETKGFQHLVYREPSNDQLFFIPITKENLELVGWKCELIKFIIYSSPMRVIKGQPEIHPYARSRLLTTYDTKLLCRRQSQVNSAKRLDLLLNFRLSSASVLTFLTFSFFDSHCKSLSTQKIFIIEAYYIHHFKFKFGRECWRNTSKPCVVL